MSGALPLRRVYIVLVNWNGWTDTIECLESLLRLDHPDFRVVVCDNGSEDDSIDAIRRWAEGRVLVEIAPEHPLRHLVDPAVAKPVALVDYNRQEAEAGGTPEGESSAPSVVLVRNEANLGFAGGNNVGMRYALARGDARYVWLLNNDTVVTPGALSALVNRADAVPDIGVCGAIIGDYGDPTKAQALGGAHFSPWNGRVRHIGGGGLLPTSMDLEAVEGDMSYVVGASMLVSRPFMEEVGLMCEDYFLYFEELDWVYRNARGGGRFRDAIAPGSLIYHKEGQATGGEQSAGGARSATADYYSNRSAVILCRRFFPLLLPLTYARISVSILRRLWLGDWRRTRAVCRGALFLAPEGGRA